MMNAMRLRYLVVGLCVMCAVPSDATFYYVNDSVTSGDVYCTSEGNVTNTGTSADSPKSSLQQIIDAFALTGGDTIYVDTGLYTNETYSLNSEGGVSASSRLVIQGSTNRNAGGTVFDRRLSSADVFYIRGSYISLRDLTLQGGRYGLTSTYGYNIDVSRVCIMSNSAGGVYDGQCGGWVMENCRFIGNYRGALLYVSDWVFNNCLFVDNTSSHIFFRNYVPVTTRNCVFVGGTTYTGSTGAGYLGDYNLFWNTSVGGGYLYVSDIGQAHSTYVNPLFANSTNLDFHKRSVEGRWNGTNWVTDSVHSPAIDLGDPTSTYTNEPTPRGSNINIGVYGNTPDASKSRTNAWLLALTFNDGGEIIGTGKLYWAYGNFTNGLSVRLDYSPDKGSNWYVITNDIPVTYGSSGYTWNVSAITSTPVAYWRVVSTNSWAVDTNDMYITLRGMNPQLHFYVNDTGTVGDVYCSAVGNAGNTGLSTNSPLLAIQDVLDRYNLGPGDTIHVDTGYYVLTNTMTLGVDDKGDENAPMTIAGSTNGAAGGTVFNRQNSGSDVLVLSSVQYVTIRNMTLRGGYRGVRLVGSNNNQLENVVSRNNVTGFRGETASANRFLRCVAYLNSTGFENFTLQNEWINGISWGNTYAFSPSASTAVTITNSVIVGGTAFGGSGVDYGDYNIFWNTLLGYTSLNEFQKAKGWWHCLYTDPFFVNSSQLDFHPQSATETYSNGTWVVYTNHSPCIDMGSPASAFTNEPSPHGSNVNIGIYGNTGEASKSRTNEWLQVMNYNDGGTLTPGTDTTDVVYWKAGNYPAGATVRIEISRSSGSAGSWEVVATGLLASAGAYQWIDTNYSSSAFARWRVVYEFNTNVYSATTYTNFSYRNGRAEYYINDDSTTDDMFCTVPGSDGNLGTSPGAPKASLKSLLSEHDVEPGDIIYIDAGNYTVTETINLTSLDGGGTNGFVYIQGSTNVTGQRTVLNGHNKSYCPLTVNGADYVDIRDITVANASIGVRFVNSISGRLERVTVYSSTYGVDLTSALGVYMDRCICYGCGQGVALNAAQLSMGRSVFWKNGVGVQVNSGSVNLRNSVVVADGVASYCYYSVGTTNIVGDYNDLYAETNAVIGYISSLARNQDTHSAWVAETAQEIHSLSVNPLFADPNSGDFHLLTEAFQGRWVEGDGWFPGYDSQTSMLIDSGDPAVACTNESAYNGSRVNIGYYGDTVEASRRTTNAWLAVASLTAGGWVKGTSALHWVVGGAATGHQVKVEFSFDGGGTWSVLTSGVAAASEEYVWDTTTLTNNSPACLWRVSSLSMPSLTDQSTNFFAVRNGALRFYVNDHQTAGDVFCAAAGVATNWMASSNRPINSLQSIVSLYELEPGDVVYVDTGIYTNTAAPILGRLESGISGSPLLVMGSTNAWAGGTVFCRGSTNAGVYGLQLENARYIVLSNLTFQNGSIGVKINNSSQLTLDYVTCRLNASNGFHVTAATNVLFRRIVAVGNGGHGLYGLGLGSCYCVNSVIWSNEKTAVSIYGGAFGVTNTVLGASGYGRSVYSALEGAVFKSDYNDIIITNDAYVAQLPTSISKSMIRWQESTSNDLHSLSHNPLFYNAGEGDFHLLSSKGRFDPDDNAFVTTDVTNSPLIDTGDPVSGYSAETAPNGGRVNIGCYGNTPQASRSDTNGWLLALTMNDGGSIRGSNAVLYWAVGGAATSHYVYIDYSPDGGVTWTNIATNVLATTGYISWDTVAYGGSPRGKWRVASQTDGAILDETDSSFSLNNGAMIYYVNDAVWNADDVYTLTAGSSLNDGLSAGSPLDSIQTVINRFDLYPGDKILVDTGNYNINSVISLGASFTGLSTNMIVIQGSTNQAAGGTIINCQNQCEAFNLNNSDYIALNNLNIINAKAGVRMIHSEGCLLEWISVKQSGYAYVADTCTNILFKHCIAANAITSGVRVLSSAEVSWQQGIMWSNRTAVEMGNSSLYPLAPAGTFSLANSMVGSFGSNSMAYGIGSGAVSSDYNCIFVTNGAYVAQVGGDVFPVYYESVSRWARATSNDLHSISRDPGFYDPDNADFHPRSRQGRYVVSTGTFVSDADTSPLIDAGAPWSTWTNETSPNGRRINIGLYGHTYEASRSPTNSVLIPLSLDDGGRIDGTNTLYWLAQGNATGHTVTLQYSTNAGASWTNIATGVPANRGSNLWDTLTYTSSLFGVWRVISESEPAVSGQTRWPFALRNEAFYFYVNDLNTNGDVYTSTAGLLTNSGLTAGNPMSSLQAVLDAWDVEPGDTIYMDTGVYTALSDTVVGQFDAGCLQNGQKMVIQGSTNRNAGGTILDGAGVACGLSLSQVADVEVRNISVRNASSGLRLRQTAGSLIEDVSVAGGLRGFDLDNNVHAFFSGCSARNASEAGVYNAVSSNTVWQNGVLWSNRVGLVLAASTNFAGARPNYVAHSNSVIVAFGAGRYAFQISGTLKSDFNDLFLTNGAMPSSLFESVSRWARDTGLDKHSLTYDPLFSSPSAGDFHPKSTAGRYSWAVTNYVLDTGISPLLDAGYPQAAYSNEPTPNGGRINLGVYGNTGEASKTPTNTTFYVISLNDGGRAEGTNCMLYWLAGGNATSQTVLLEFSGDGGYTWQIIASGIPAKNESFSWDTTLYASTMQGVWKITSGEEPSATAQTRDFFAVRNESISFFVNDSGRTGDVFTTAAGLATNNGLLASSPADSVQAILDRWDIESGDTIFIDTGSYSNTAGFILGGFDAGSTNALEGAVIIQGSTNGTILDCTGKTMGISLTNAGLVELRNMSIRNAETGVNIENSQQCVLDWIFVEGGTTGFRINESDYTTFQHCLVKGASSKGLSVANSGGLVWETGILWSNTYAISLESGGIAVQNSILGVFGAGSCVYYNPGSALAADYNVIFLTNGAVAGYQLGTLPTIYHTVSRWVNDTGNDGHSFTGDPLFYNVVGGDYHLLSEGGRFDPGIKNFISDSRTSPGIDAGDPSSVYTNELSPHGRRCNIGLYANSAEASKTSTNSALVVLSLNDGGYVRGAKTLFWNARGNATGHTVSVWFSADGGSGWALLGSNIPASQRFFVWDTRLNSSSVLGVWQVQDEVESAVFDRSDVFFAVRNDPLNFYVNDASIDGDAYTTSVGDPANLGSSPAEPKDSVAGILDAWDLEPGDTIYVDTGQYWIENTLTIDRFDAWESTNAAESSVEIIANRVTIQGSTNEQAGGTVLNKYGGGGVIQLDNAIGVALRNLVLRDGSSGLQANSSDFCLAEWVKASRCNVGFDINQSDFFEFMHCTASENTFKGLGIDSSKGVIWRQGLFWSNMTYGAFLADSGRRSSALTIEGSVFGCFGSNVFGGLRVAGTWVSDYNSFYLRDGAFAAGVIPSLGYGGSTTRYESVYLWSKTYLQDQHSLTPTSGPAFANSAAGDFHLRTPYPEGRYDALLQVWTNDDQVSHLIDAGRPASSYTNEPPPNGSRINIGLYGNSTQASKTPTNGWLECISYNDGGSLSDIVTLRWVAGGVATGYMVRIDFSAVAGLMWTTVVASVPATDGECSFDPKTVGRSFAGLWRVTVISDTNISDTSDEYLTISTNFGGSVWYFVNDGNTNGDVFCSAAGNSTNMGYAPEAPCSSLKTILESRKLEAGDRIYVDTGTYNEPSTIVLNDLDSGNATNKVLILGSTNYTLGGSIIDHQNEDAPVISMDTATGYELRDLTLCHGSDGLTIANSEACTFLRIRSEDNGVNGMAVYESEDLVFQQCVSWNNGDTNGVGFLTKQSGCQWTGGVIWGNSIAVRLQQGQGENEFRNCIMQVSGIGRAIYSADADAGLGGIVSDYNNLIHEDEANVAQQELSVGGANPYQYLLDWRKWSSQDIHSYSHAPLFADEVNGDFRLKSESGRIGWDLSTTNDTVTSPLIDAGDPSSSYTNEPSPNGSRVNMGNYGDTPYASHTKTNPWLVAVSPNDGGTIGGTALLTWAWGGMTNGSTVRLEYSVNDGIEWQVLASNVVNVATGFSWDVSGLRATAKGKWKVVSESCSVTDECDNVFSIKNNALTIYVNDTNTEGDVYCVGVGRPFPSNSGLTNDQAIDNPLVAFEEFPLGPGDTVFIDTGVYSLSDDMYIGEHIRGISGLVVRIQGSTNWLAGGTLLDRNDAAGVGLLINESRYIEVNHLRFKRANVGVSVQNSLNTVLNWIECFSNLTAGFSLSLAVPANFNHCFAWNNSGWGLIVGGGSAGGWGSGVLWSNRLGAVSVQSGFAISNSILHAGNSNSLVYYAGSSFSGDYNLLQYENGANFLFYVNNGEYFANLQELQSAWGIENHSYVVAPLFANAAGGDFHLRSKGGRFSPAVSNYVTSDSFTSWAIDAGNPVSTYGNEPLPNGSRLNLGLYGNTCEASKSITNPADRALFAASLTDGGMISGGKTLTWLSQGMSLGDTVRLEYSVDSGQTWVMIATNLSAISTGYYWNVSAITSTPSAFWRVVSESNPSVVDTNDTEFVIRNGPIRYYVNDEDTDHDIYTTAKGSITNLGFFAYAPKNSISDVLARYDIEPGDTIYVDTGHYLLTNNTLIGSLDQGSSSEMVGIIGSTNRWGSVLEGRTNAVFYLKAASYILLSHMTLTNTFVSIKMENSSGNVVSNVICRNGYGIGIQLVNSPANYFRHVAVANIIGIGVENTRSSGNVFENCVVWSNTSHAMQLRESTVEVSNSVLSAVGANNMIYYSITNSTVSADYNDLYVRNGAVYGNVIGVPMQGLPQWSKASTQDVHSLAVDPLFTDSGVGDFHLKSQMGRYDPLLETFVATDTVTSLLIDTGNPRFSCAEEPAPNEGRINIGLYGNTAEASKSYSTNWLLALTASSGGRLNGVFYLAWNALGFDPTNRVTLEYSYDNGGTWSNIATSVIITNWQYLWNSALLNSSTQEVWWSSPLSRWKITVEANTNITDVTDSRFTLRNKPISYYVNDAFRTNDVFTTAIGNDTNYGVHPSIPKATLRGLLEDVDIDIEGGDYVYIDSGNYEMTTNSVATIGSEDAGDSSEPVYYRGNTNNLYTVFEKGAGQPSLTFLTINGSYIDLTGLYMVDGGIYAEGSDLTLYGLVLTNGSVYLNGADQILEDSRINNGDVGISGKPILVRRNTVVGGTIYLSGTNIVCENNLVYGGSGPAMEVSGDAVSVQNNTLVAGGNQFVKRKGGSATLRDNIIRASGTDAFCIYWEGGVLDSDYNNLQAQSGAWIGTQNGNWENLLYWQRESGKDSHSISADPLFADEANHDYHLKSVMGRWTIMGWTNDSTHSPCIDTGNPTSTWTNEPSGNGRRVNMGAYGNTAQASKSRTNAWVMAITMNDGGVLKGTGVLTWASGNVSSTNTLILQYSSNGAIWSNIAVGVPASANEYLWDTTAFVSSLTGYWRIILDIDAAVTDRVDSSFAVRNTPLSFYVNDTYVATSDVFTTASGSAAYNGLAPATPKNSIQAILNAYDTEGGDTIYVDTGLYNLSSDITVIWSRGGDASYGDLIICGSTNGSVISRNNLSSGNDGFEVKGSYITLRDLAVRNAYRGVMLDSNRFNCVERILAYSNVYGVVVSKGTSTVVRNIRAWNNAQGGIDVVGSQTTVVENCTIVASNGFGLRAQSAQDNTFQNNLFYLTTSNSVALSGDSGSIENRSFIDYNVYFSLHSTTYIYGTNSSLLQWQLNQSNDFRSAITNPLLADVNSGDFHLCSVGGRYIDGVGWTNDVSSSWAIDKGNPDSLYANEPVTNGARINIGAYGNTEYASKSSTNATVYARMFNDAVVIDEDNSVWPLIWTTVNVPPTELFTIQYSGDGGDSWVNLATGVSSYAEYIVWNTTPYYNTFKGLWRIVGESNTNYWDVNDVPYTIFYGEYAIKRMYQGGGWQGIVWRGAWDEEYQVQYATNDMRRTTNGFLWMNAPTGALPYQVPYFISTNGGDFTYEDVDASNSSRRIYRVIDTRD